MIPMTDSGEIVSARYRAHSVILHHGQQPTHGHYTCLIRRATAGYWLVDDERIPQGLTHSEAAALAARDMYVVCMIRVV